MHPTRGLGDLPAVWRQRAEFLAEYGDPNSARLWQLAAVEVERALAALGEESLNLEEAAEASGYTADHVGSLVRKGKISNVGRTNAPRIRRADLPHKNPKRPGRPRHKREAARKDIAKLR